MSPLSHERHSCCVRWARAFYAAVALLTILAWMHWSDDWTGSNNGTCRTTWYIKTAPLGYQKALRARTHAATKYQNSFTRTNESLFSDDWWGKLPTFEPPPLSIRSESISSAVKKLELDLRRYDRWSYAHPKGSPLSHEGHLCCARPARVFYVAVA